MTSPGEALRYYPPSPALAPYVNLLFSWTGAAGHAGWMPAIQGQIAIRLSGRGRFRFTDGRCVSPPPVAVIGPLSGTVHMTVSDGMRSVGAGLTATGWQLLTGLPADKGRDEVLDLGWLWGEAAVRTVLARLIEAGDHAVAVLDTILRARACSAFVRGDPRAAAIDRWLVASPAFDLDGLAHWLALSPRQVARLTLATHGLSPKLLAMKHRALRTANALAVRPLAGCDHGYADQSHMIRDFRRFIGATPGAFVEADVARHVFEEPERVGASLIHGRS